MTKESARTAYKNFQNVAEQTFGCDKKDFNHKVTQIVEGTQPEDFLVAAQKILKRFQEERINKTTPKKRGRKQGRKPQDNKKPLLAGKRS